MLILTHPKPFEYAICQKVFRSYGKLSKTKVVETFQVKDSYSSTWKLCWITPWNVEWNWKIEDPEELLA